MDEPRPALWLTAAVVPWAIAGALIVFPLPLFFLLQSRWFARDPRTSLVLGVYTILLVALVAATQSLFVRATRPFFSGWVGAAAGGACVAWIVGWTFGFIGNRFISHPSNGPLLPPAMMLIVILVRGAFYATLASLTQRWALRERFRVPGYFILTAALASATGSFCAFYVAVSALSALR